MLVDDLITRGTTEPYRMFTSRAEHRLLLREDNADARLTPTGRQLGLVDDYRWRIFNAKQDAIAVERERLGGIVIQPADAALEPTLRREQRALELLKRPDVDYAWLTALAKVGQRVAGAGEYPELAGQIDAQVEIEARYAGYVQRQHDEIARNRGTDELKLPEDLDYALIHGLSHEIRQKLSRQRPATVGQASRISGVTPVAVSLLLVHLKKRRLRTSAGAGAEASA